ncbi:hypothetical protein A2865_04235 [Candidatus Woesebacteria bacterium RIFCSPHIGHO2_01_FULL_39_17]|uniref:Competence protein ComEA helix-hairpin-helix repeat protein n=3 Tax=Candidatus Woeseibacteriota TaxID=1752722 RepID=A0A0G0N8Z8_9BACT|nr:MAG: Competence protein ComEA helix-hairpin-helix repeat protein [Microgenomates group bacterium GW2011_GWC1_38_12]KKQ93195.1 MAG: Competence protein ComEA helix-hairpin-helix repeat protein [Candidatus Woesebacteria bacterium GW2011_GWB1_39_10b]KKR11938.1 MAG: Competence protein ComEA helix-hairpin-helix repeat protein [Candidatus Woesebacteria bacterium GW2011_GWA1_39_21b]OGM23330.1 MAG: hypothetical protein A2865_04235 [Candidatus Woesebacteria bacterium RIFCSPHIGHO2_01_FULL_39_17]OGM6351
MSSHELVIGSAKEENTNHFKKQKKLDLEEFVLKYRYPITVFLLGVFLTGIGMIYVKMGESGRPSNIEVLNEVAEVGDQNSELVVEISGAVEKPGVYKLPGGSRVEDLLISAGGISIDADRDWVERVINRAARLTDGQKIYIPKVGEQTLGESANNGGDIKLYQGVRGSGYENLVNVNISSQKELEELPGIGPVYAQSIIEHRPYSNVEELVSKGALKQYVYEKIKDLVTVY